MQKMKKHSVSPDSLERFDFVPDLIPAVMMSHYQHGAEVHQMLQDDWVSEWKGWCEAREVLESAECDDQCANIPSNYLQQFSRLHLQDMSVTTKSDSHRKAELLEVGFCVGSGLVFRCNVCVY